LLVARSSDDCPLITIIISPTHILSNHYFLKDMQASEVHLNITNCG